MISLFSPLVLTDGDFRIIGLLRTHDYDDTTKVRVGAIYPINLTSRLCTGSASISLPPAPTTAEAHEEKVSSPLTWENLEVSALQEWILQQKPSGDPVATQVTAEANKNGQKNNNKNTSKNKSKGESKSKSTAKKKKKKKDNRFVLKHVLAGIKSPVAAFGPNLVEHCLLLAGADPDQDICGEWSGLDETCAAQLVAAFRQMPQLLQRVKTVRAPGYILLRPDDSSSVPKPAEDKPTNDALYYERVVPLLLEQHKSCRQKQFSSFNAAVDEFFSLSESRSLERQRLRQQQQNAKQLDKVKHGLDNRMDELNTRATDHEHAAYLVELNASLVDAAISVIRGALANSISWSDIKQLVEQQKQLGHPVAQIISRLKLEENVIILLLPDPDNDGENVTVEIDVTLSSYANANALHSKCKGAKSKLAKTKEMAAEALESAKRKIDRQKKKNPAKQEAQVIRKRYWFEKFHWFIAPGDYVVVSGQSAQQNELLVKRYLRKGDAYVHADLRGASSCIVVNHRSGEPIPPSVLEMAGTMTVCRSVAWSAGIIASAWWVEAHQVSKTAPSGEYLTTGSFMIRGKKTFLHPKRLEMGMSMLFVRKRKESTVDDPLSPAPGTPTTPSVDEDTPMPVADEKDDVGAAEVDAAAMVDGAVTSESVEASVAEHAGTGDPEIDSAPATVPPRLPSEAVAAAASTDITSPVPGAETVIIATRHAAPDDPEDPRAEGAINLTQYERYQQKLHSEQREAVSKHREQKKQAQKEMERKQQEVPAGSKKAPRGRRGKMKRMKARYMDQDDEERKLRMSLLGNPVKSKGKRKGNKNKMRQQHETVNDTPEPDANANEVAADKSEETPVSTPDAPSESPSIFSDDAERTTVQVETLFEEKKQQDLASQLCRAPSEEDELLHCIPMCAPYAALQNCKFKVKLVPGKMKRGKACKAVMGMFRASKLCTPAEQKLFQRLENDQTMVRSMLSDTKVVPAQSLQVSKSKNKKSQKKKQKSKSTNEEKKNADQKKANPTKQKRSKNKKKKR